MASASEAGGSEAAGLSAAADGVRRVALACEAGDELLSLTTPAHLNVNKVSRQLRRADVSMSNCLLSVDSDARFVSRVAQRFPALPVVANLRCGLWYVEQPDETAYFKVRRSPASQAWL